MDKQHSPESMSLADATYAVLNLMGPEALANPTRFLSSVLDHVNAETTEMYCFTRNCDDEYLDPFVTLMSRYRPPESESISSAAAQAADYLIHHWAIDYTFAEQATKHITQGIEWHLGLVPYEDADSHPGSIAEATRRALAEGGIACLADADTFRNLLVQHLGAETTESRMLYRNCDQDFVSFFADATSASELPAEELRHASQRAENLLAHHRAIQPEVAHTVSEQIAAGIARYLGLEPSGGSTPTDTLGVTYVTPKPYQTTLEGIVSVSESEMQGGFVRVEITNTGSRMAHIQQLGVTGKKKGAPATTMRKSLSASLAPGKTAKVVVGSDELDWSDTQRSYILNGFAGRSQTS